MTFIPAETIDKSIFGESVVVNDSPTIQISNQYEIDPAVREDLEIFEGTGGSADNNGNLFRCQSGTSVGGFGVIRSKATARYRPGQGIVARFTAAFTTGIATSLQFGGLFSLTETLAFGYDGSSFSAIHEYDGVAEIQSLQVTVAATVGANCTVTIDGDAVAIALTVATVQTNAEQIRAGLEANGTISGKWRFEQVDDKVICIAKAVGNKTSTMSYAAGTTGSAAAFTEVAAGVTKTSNNTAQASWDSAPFTGFDPTQLNIYQVEYGYLGAAGPRFSVYNPATGSFQVVFQGLWANTHTTPLFGNPDMKIGWAAASLGSSGTNLTVTGASAFVAIQGQEEVQNASRAFRNSKASISTTLTNVLTIENRIVYGTRFNLGDILPVSVSVDNDHTKGIIVEIYKNATLGGTTNFQYVNENNSIAITDIAGTTVTGGTLVGSFTVPKDGDAEQDLTQLKIVLFPEERITVAVKTVSGTATNTTAAFTWLEEK